MTRARTVFLLAILAGALPAARTPAAQGSASAPASGMSARLTSQPGQPAPPAAQGTAAGQPEKVYKIDTAGAPSRGPRGAAVTIVEFSDYQ
jgi:protein-disulfide isomerase